MAKIENIVDELSALTMLDLVRLVKALEDKWGLNAAPVAVAVHARPAHVNEDEGTYEYCVELTNAGGKKVDVINLVSEIRGLGLGEARALVEAAPRAVKECVLKAEAERIKKELEAAGATVTIK